MPKLGQDDRAAAISVLAKRDAHSSPWRRDEPGSHSHTVTLRSLPLTGQALKDTRSHSCTADFGSTGDSQEAGTPPPLHRRQLPLGASSMVKLVCQVMSPEAQLPLDFGPDRLDPKPTLFDGVVVSNDAVGEVGGAGPKQDPDHDVSVLHRGRAHPPWWWLDHLRSLVDLWQLLILIFDTVNCK